MVPRGATTALVDHKCNWYAQTLHIATNTPCSDDSMCCHWNLLARALLHNFKMQKPSSNEWKQMFCTWNVKTVKSMFICIQHFLSTHKEKKKKALTISLLNFIKKMVSVTHRFFHPKA